MDPLAAGALRAYALLAKRVVYDFRLQEYVFDALGLTFDSTEEAIGLLDRLEILHQMVNPPVKGKAEDPL